MRIEGADERTMALGWVVLILIVGGISFRNAREELVAFVGKAGVSYDPRCVG